MRVQMLLTDGFGGFGGISRFNRDFLSALNGCSLVERVYAAACDIQVVGSSVDGSPDALLDGQLGRMVDPTKPDDLVLAIGAAINARQRRVRNRPVETFGVDRFRTRVNEWLRQQVSGL